MPYIPALRTPISSGGLMLNIKQSLSCEEDSHIINGRTLLTLSNVLSTQVENIIENNVVDVALTFYLLSTDETLIEINNELYAYDWATSTIISSFITKEIYGNDTTYERCPHCDSEVLLNAILHRQHCPKCHKLILPCSICTSRGRNCHLCVH